MEEHYLKRSMHTKWWTPPENSGTMITGCLLDEEEIRNRLKRTSFSQFEATGTKVYRPAAVLIPLLCFGNSWHLLFTRRTDLVQSHKGQVSFPGGAVETTDSSAVEAALREAQEEIGLAPDNVQILGQMDDFPTITQYRVTPVVGRIQSPFEMRLSPDEVSRAFIIPVKWLADPANWEERPYQSSNGEMHRVVFYREYDGELLWGITARMTLIFLEQAGLF